LTTSQARHEIVKTPQTVNARLAYKSSVARSVGATLRHLGREASTTGTVAVSEVEEEGAGSVVPVEVLATRVVGREEGVALTVAGKMGLLRRCTKAPQLLSE